MLEIPNSERLARLACKEGIAVLGYLSRSKGQITEDILSTVEGFIDRHLRRLGFDDPNTIERIQYLAIRHIPTREEMLEAIVNLSDDLRYFTLVFEAASTISRKQRELERANRDPLTYQCETLDTLRMIATAKGWLSDYKSIETATETK